MGLAAASMTPVIAWAARSGRPFAPHMEPGAAERFDAVGAPGHGIPSGTVDWAATRTHAREGAPAGPRGGRRPVVLYSPGAGDPRTWGTVWVEEFARAQQEGTVPALLEKLLRVRVADARFVLASFFDRWLRHRDDHLLDGPSPRYPEVAFVE